MKTADLIVSTRISEGEKRIAAYQLVDYLERLGVEVIFGLCGHTVIAFLDALRGFPLRIDCGESDPFAPALTSLRFPDPTAVHVTKGCHEYGFWRSVAPVQLRLIGSALAHKTT